MDAAQFFPIYDTPGHIIRRAHQLSTALFDRDMAASGVTPAQFGVLRIVCARPGLEQLEIAQAVFLDPATTGGVLRRLETLGLVRRTPSGRSGRGRSVSPTDAGVRLLGETQEAFLRSREQLLAKLDDDERRALLSLLEKMCETGPAEA